MWVRMEKILAVVLREAYQQQVKEVMNVLCEGLGSLYGKVLEPPRDEGNEID